ncbi:ABC transporter substrate-binding protein [Thermodesulfatator autotrophicus]|uniref:ABC transporter substrate-binding protein n=1 Tax=Thermodesulfatator autotrophicus TaxID=1795632 RepID=A0A177EBY2_9BACT|nr:ABC transporter substrate-binding protein [Thermodesulfatator autotrophicus]OAG28509.1 ABC transporter substrate-binding protein [Thermodesulfatator autotrophicus]
MKRLLLFFLILLLGFSTPILASEKEPIKIGALFALSGPAAFIGTPTKLVAEMAVDEINKQGGINGRPIKLIMADTEGDPTKAVMAVKRLIEVEKVVALIGPTRTGTGMAIKPIVEKARVPIVMTVGGDPVIMEGGRFGTARFIFKAPQRSSTAVKKIYIYLREKGLKRVAILTASDGFGQDGRRWLKKLAPEFGLTIVGEESFNPTDTDMSGQLRRLVSKKPQVIICWTIGPAGANVAKNVKRLGIKVPLFQCHGLPDPKYIEIAGPAAEGNLMPSTKLMAWEQLPDSDPQKPVIAHFVYLYKEVYKLDKKFPINTHSGYAWDAVNLLVLAMKKAGPDREGIRNELEKINGYVGVSGIYRLSPKDHCGLDVDSMIIVKIENGQWKLEAY